jgi:hypothetical protein
VLLKMIGDSKPTGTASISSLAGLLIKRPHPPWSAHAARSCRWSDGQAVAV